MRPRSHSSSFSLLRSWLLRQQTSAEQGLTLIECLVAVVVATLTVVTITPPIFLATASRIQSRRAEQANQIAQGEIDRVRNVMERGTYTTYDLPALATGTATAFAAPTDVEGVVLSSGSCANKYPQQQTIPDPNDATKTITVNRAAASNKLVPVDIDGDCTPEFAMQVFRASDCIPPDLIAAVPVSPPYAFSVGVRVYAYKPGETATYIKDRGVLGLTTGRKDQSGGEHKPLQTIYTKVVRGGSAKSIACAGETP